jgi:hypothetical protein
LGITEKEIINTCRYMRYINNVYIQYSNNVHIQLLAVIKQETSKNDKRRN